MKKAIFGILLFIALAFVLPLSAAAGANVTFAWDANTESDLAGYRLYQSSTSGSYTFGPSHAVASVPAGTESVTINVTDGTWYWVLTAYDTDNNESAPSNEVTATIDQSQFPNTPSGVAIEFKIYIMH